MSKYICDYCDKEIKDYKNNMWSKDWTSYHPICFLRKQSEEKELFEVLKDALKIIKKK